MSRELDEFLAGVFGEGRDTGGRRPGPPAWERARARARLEHGDAVPAHLRALFEDDASATTSSRKRTPPRRPPRVDGERMLRELRAAEAAIDAEREARWEAHRAEREAGWAAYKQAREGFAARYGVAASAPGPGWPDRPWPARVF